MGITRHIIYIGKPGPTAKCELKIFTFPKLPFPRTTRRLKSSIFILGRSLERGLSSLPRLIVGRALAARVLLSDSVALRNSSISC